MSFLVGYVALISRRMIMWILYRLLFFVCVSVSDAIGEIDELWAGSRYLVEGYQKGTK